MPHSELHARQKKKNLAILVILLVLMVLLFAVTIIKTGAQLAA